MQVIKGILKNPTDQHAWTHIPPNFKLFSGSLTFFHMTVLTMTVACLFPKAICLTLIAFAASWNESFILRWAYFIINYKNKVFIYFNSYPTCFSSFKIPLLEFGVVRKTVLRLLKQELGKQFLLHDATQVVWDYPDLLTFCFSFCRWSSFQIPY